jgi:hypothetical protein
MKFQQGVVANQGPNEGMSSPFHGNFSQFLKDTINNGDNIIATRGEKDEETSLILRLEQQIKELGRALKQSEEERAQAIEEFQYERKNYTWRYREMSDILKQFLDSNNLNCNGSQQR